MRTKRTAIECLVRMVAMLPLPGLVMAQAPATADRFPPAGRLVEVGGHRLHLNCTGHGGPTVVIENGTGDFSFDWSLVQPVLSRQMRVCTYDRAGYAWSEPGPQPRTFQQIALELHTGLHKLEIKGPYVLVGQSSGGFPARAFAKYYPQEVAGMVLVDALHEDSRVIIGGQAVRIRELAPGRDIPASQLKPTPKTPPARAPEAGQPAPASSKLEPPLDRLPPQIQQTRLWAQSQPDYQAASSNEREWSAEELARMSANRESLNFP